MADALEFQIEIGLASGSSCYPVAAFAEGGGEAASTMEWALSGRELEVTLASIRDSILASSATTRRLPTSDEQPVRRFGQMLFDAVMVGDVRLLFSYAYQRSRHEGRPLRLILRPRPAELACLPWEYMYDSSSDEYLGLKMAMVRHPHVMEPQRPLKVSPPLKILAMAARPGDLAVLDTQGEMNRLEASIADLQRRGQVNLGWVQGQTWRDLQRAMDRDSWHVFHFIGHGGFDARNDEGILALADEEGVVSPLRAGGLGMLLGDHLQLRLVVLNACDTGRSSAFDSFSSTSGALIRRGVPAVLAMQFEITDIAATEFTRTFYDELARGQAVDACVMRARRAIHIARTNSLEWGTPVLHLRSGDVRIFDTSSESHELTGRQRAGEMPVRPTPTVERRSTSKGQHLSRLRPRGQRVWYRPWMAIAGIIALLGFSIVGAIRIAPAVERSLATTLGLTPVPLAAALSRNVLDDNLTHDRGWALGYDYDFPNAGTQWQPGSLNVTVDAPHEVHYVFAPVPAFDEVKESVTLAWNAGNGSAGLACQADLHSGYEFRFGADGSYEIDVEPGDASGRPSSTLKRKVDAPWGPERQAEIVAICALQHAAAGVTSDAKLFVQLQLLVNGKTVLETTDAEYLQPFRPAIFVDGPIDISLLQAAIYTTPL